MEFDDEKETKSEAERMRQDFSDNKEDITEMVSVMTEIADELFDQHGEKVANILSKFIKLSANTIIEAVDDNMIEDIAEGKAQLIYKLNFKLKDLGFNDDLRIKLICAAINKG